ncbi:MAG TPA: choice-of-anchor tandem repeat GloVer-containing protein [Pirellulales bacterium]|nr:choice-of-anchor tandem repeat GloVer-containing protein [Pirellulales bacterium]
MTVTLNKERTLNNEHLMAAYSGRFARWLLLAAALMPTIHGAAYADGYSFSTLVSFDATNGRNPAASVIIDGAGNLYGTTETGGTSSAGNVFEIAAGSNTATTLVSLNGFSDGRFPVASLISDGAGIFFGTASEGGSSGDGTVFDVAAGSNTVTTLAAFTGSNGLEPAAALISDAAGNLYGTAEGGGASGAGTVFEVASGSHTLTTLVSFNGGSNGAFPLGSLVTDAAGNLYGTTYGGGAFNRGTVFEIAAGSHTITTLVSFDGTNGAQPAAGLIADASGNLYGTTSDTAFSSTVFEISAQSHALTTLATFPGDTTGTNILGGLVLDGVGNLYGTTASGGPSGDGTVFEIAAGSNAITTLVTFNGANGANPEAGLLLDPAGNLYGTTYSGGANNDGTVFKLSPVPEPSTLVLLGLSGPVLFWYGRRYRRR